MACKIDPTNRNLSNFIQNIEQVKRGESAPAQICTNLQTYEYKR